MRIWRSEKNHVRRDGSAGRFGRSDSSNEAQTGRGASLHQRNESQPQALHSNGRIDFRDSLAMHGRPLPSPYHPASSLLPCFREKRKKSVDQRSRVQRHRRMPRNVRKRFCVPSGGVCIMAWVVNKLTFVFYAHKYARVYYVRRRFGDEVMLG